MAPGTYRVRATAGGAAAKTLVAARIDSVTIGSGGAELVLQGLGSYPITAVRQFS
jgi:hypothetical protein